MDRRRTPRTQSFEQHGLFVWHDWRRALHSRASSDSMSGVAAAEVMATKAKTATTADWKNCMIVKRLGEV